MVENSLGLLTSPENKPERGNPHVQIILLQGMLDIGLLSPPMARQINAAPHDPEWYNKKVSFKKMLARLDEEVKVAKEDGKEVILVGVSAGGGLGLAYMILHPDNVSYLFTLDGVVDPDIPKNGKAGNLDDLRKRSPSFRDLTDFLTEQLHPNGELDEHLIKSLRLAERISTYSSNADEIVPLAVSEPSWAKIKRRVGSGIHAVSIGRTLLHDIHEQIKPLERARLD